jgi:hypothetical protein
MAYVVRRIGIYTQFNGRYCPGSYMLEYWNHDVHRAYSNIVIKRGRIHYRPVGYPTSRRIIL